VTGRWRSSLGLPELSCWIDRGGRRQRRGVFRPQIDRVMCLGLEFKAGRGTPGLPVRQRTMAPPAALAE
jgi:hypothetical protein